MILKVNENCLLMTSLCLNDIDTSANDFNRDLEKISEWGFFQCKRSHQTGARNNIKQEKYCFYSTSCLI